MDVGYESKLEETEDIRASYLKLESIVALITDDSKLTLYEGLPGQIWNREQFESELKIKGSINRFGYSFYKNPNEVSAEDIKSLKTVIKNPKSFRKFSGHKGCGGAS